MRKKTVNQLPKILPGSVQQQFKKCGKPNCRCAAGQLHGPYYYHFVRINGKPKKRYLRSDEVGQVEAACQRRRCDEKVQRERLQASWKELRQIRTELCEFRKNYNL